MLDVPQAIDVGDRNPQRPNVGDFKAHKRAQWEEQEPGHGSIFGESP